MVIFKNNASIISIHTKGNTLDYNNYGDISLINNELKIIAKSKLIESLNMELIKDLLDLKILDFVTEKNV